MTGRGEAVTIGTEAVLRALETTRWARFISYRPADGQTVHLNPPRFCWPYLPEIVPAEPLPGGKLPDLLYTLQIAADRDFSRVLQQAGPTTINFYNLLKPLPKPGRYWWRVIYRWPDGNVIASRTRCFVIAEDAAVWDRSRIRSKWTASEHPRVIFNEANIEALRKLASTHPLSKAVFAESLRQAERTLASRWWHKMPPSDRVGGPELAVKYGLSDRFAFLRIAREMANVAFVYMITADGKYLSVIDRLLKFCEYPPGGWSSPEGAGGNEDCCQITEYLALMYDWLYRHLTDQQRKIVLEAIRWRTEHTINNFSWRLGKGQRKRLHNVGLSEASHVYEDFMDTLVAGLAAWEDGPIFKLTYDLAVNYLIGVNTSYGTDGTHNEGPGYGNSKMLWLMHATAYYDMSLPELDLHKNPYYASMAEFFRWIVPLGLKRSCWGNGSAKEGYILGNRTCNALVLAWMLGDGRIWHHYLESCRYMGRDLVYDRPWIAYALPHFYQQPRPQPETGGVRTWQEGGWVVAMRHSPAEYDKWQENVGVIFVARPKGGYQHSFFCDGSFQFFAYGQDLTSGGGSTGNKDVFAYHAMSHNTVLINGLGQAQPLHWRISNFTRSILPMRAARLAAFQAKGDVAYFAADLTSAYLSKPRRVAHWWGTFGEAYQARPLPPIEYYHRHVLFIKNRYLLVLDDIKLAEPHSATFTWLYHVPRADGVNYDAKTATLKYDVNGIRCMLRHLPLSGPLSFEDRQGQAGAVNPITGEDYRSTLRGDPGEHHFWFTTRHATNRQIFAVVIYPLKKGEAWPRIEMPDANQIKIAGPEGTQTIDLHGGPGDISVDLASLRRAIRAQFNQPRTRDIAD